MQTTKAPIKPTAPPTPLIPSNHTLPEHTQLPYSDGTDAIKEQERQHKEKLATYLRELGINPDKI